MLLLEGIKVLVIAIPCAQLTAHCHWTWTIHKLCALVNMYMSPFFYVDDDFLPGQ